MYKQGGILVGMKSNAPFIHAGAWRALKFTDVIRKMLSTLLDSFRTLVRAKPSSGKQIDRWGGGGLNSEGYWRRWKCFLW